LVAPLFFHFVQLSENDRYGSLFVPFLSLLIVVIGFNIHKRLGLALVIGYAGLGFYCQQHLVSQWQHSQDIVASLYDSYPHHLKGDILMVNLPDNLNGTFMYRSYAANNPYLSFLRMRDHEPGKIDLVVQYNMATNSQRLSLDKQLDDGTYVFSLSEWGSWWWRHGIGASSYQTECYSARLEAKTIYLKILKPDCYDHIIYNEGVQWKILF